MEYKWPKDNIAPQETILSFTYVYIYCIPGYKVI